MLIISPYLFEKHYFGVKLMCIITLCFSLALAGPSFVPLAVGDDFPTPPPDPVAPPLKQFHDGVPIHEIKCNQYLEPILRLGTLSPICVNDTAIDWLVQKTGIVFSLKNIQNEIDDNDPHDRNGLAASVAKKIKPHDSIFPPAYSILRISEPPKLGDTAQITLVTTIWPYVYHLGNNSATFEIPLYLPEGFEMVNSTDFIFRSSETASFTAMADNTRVFTHSIQVPPPDDIQTITSTATIRAVQPGIWTVNGLFSYLHMDIGQEKSFHMCDDIDIILEISGETKYVELNQENVHLAEQTIVNKATTSWPDDSIRVLKELTRCMNPPTIDSKTLQINDYLQSYYNIRWGAGITIFNIVYVDPIEQFPADRIKKGFIEIEKQSAGQTPFDYALVDAGTFGLPADQHPQFDNPLDIHNKYQLALSGTWSDKRYVFENMLKEIPGITNAKFIVQGIS